MRGWLLWSVVCIAGLGTAAGVGIGVRYSRGEPEPPPPALPAADIQDTDQPPVPGETPAELSEAERAYLWDIEHHGNVLNRYGFQPLAAALSRADRPALLRLLSPDFAGRIFSQPQEVRRHEAFAEVVRQTDAGRPPQALDRDRFVDRFLEYRRPFGTPPRVQLALQALAPMERGNLDASWQGTCLLRMWGETRPGQPREVALTLSYRLPRPSEKRLGEGGWLRSCSISQSQEASASRRLLREVAAERGIDVAPLHDNWRVDPKDAWIATGGVYLCDFNRDGILDLLITDLNRFAFYQGLPGGRFKEVTEQVGLPRRPERQQPSGMIAAFADLDGDGWEDLLLGGVLYRNDQGRRFVPVSTNLGLPLDATAAAVADYDRDGRVDLYILRVSQPNARSWLSGKTGVPWGNLLLHNLGNWQFENVAVAAGVGGGQRSTFSAVWLDANNDGWPDLYVINEFGDGVLYINQGDGTFRERALVDHPNDFGSMGVTCGDIDNDGNIDLYVANMYSKAGNRIIGNLRPDTYPADIMARMRRFTAGSQLYRNKGVSGEWSGVSGKERPAPEFEPLGAAYQVTSVGWAFGAALVDLDNDGFLDLYATAGYMSRTRSEPDG
jgi:hypothetical protein